MPWSIGEVARHSGLTARTLRHYDEIGLLEPAFVAANGHRHYERGQLLRLQQILVLRELGVALPEIGRILDAQTDRIEALRGHRQRLLAERDRLARLAATVERTIGDLEREKSGATVETNRPENLFEGFDDAQHADEARRRWPGQYEESRPHAASLTAADKARMGRESTAAMIRTAELMAAGTSVDDEAVQREMHAHYVGICRFWTPDARAFRCLGQIYVDDGRFTANYDRIAVGLAAYYRDAMAQYADTRFE